MTRPNLRVRRIRQGSPSAWISFAVLVGMSAWVSQANAELHVEAVRTNGSRVSGVWMPSSEAGRVIIRTPIRQEFLGIDDMMSLRVLQSSENSLSQDWPVSISCRNGSILPAEILDGDAAQVVLRTPFADTIALQISQLLEVRWPRDKSSCREIDESVATRNPGKDLLVVMQEDTQRTLEGTLDSLSTQGGKFVFRDRLLEFDSASACALRIAGAGKVKTDAVICIMNEWYQLAGRIEATTEDSVLLRGIAGTAITLPLAEMQEIRFNSSRVVYLSDLQPGEVRHKSFFNVSWPMRFDKAVSNQAMSMKSRRYVKGIGVHSNSEIAYQLDDDYASLAATIGIDDLVRPSGHVVFRVLGDGKELFNSGAVRGSDQPRDIEVRLDGIQTIRLVVEQGEELDIGDHANWADARLIRR